MDVPHDRRRGGMSVSVSPEEHAGAGCRRHLSPAERRLQSEQDAGSGTDERAASASFAHQANLTNCRSSAALSAASRPFDPGSLVRLSFVAVASRAGPPARPTLKNAIDSWSCSAWLLISSAVEANSSEAAAFCCVVCINCVTALLICPTPE